MICTIHETSIEAIHPPAPMIEVMSSTEGTISFVSSLSEYAGYSAENFFITCTSGASLYSAASVTGEITTTGMLNGLIYACTGHAENNGFMSGMFRKRFSSATAECPTEANNY